MKKKKVFNLDWNGSELIVETGRLAQQANGAVLVRLDDTVVLSVAVGKDEPSSADFFPLTINYEEKMYAAGKLPGGFLKREGRPSDHATLTARMIDRPIRPLFAEGYRNEVQITNTVLSVDPNHQPEMLAMFGSSLALSISDIPFNGPIAGVEVSHVNGEFVVNASLDERNESDLHLTVAGTSDAINMVESQSDIVPEEDILEALGKGFEEIKVLIAFQNEIVESVGKAKMEVEVYQPDVLLETEIKKAFNKEMKEAIQTFDKLERAENVKAVKKKIIELYQDRFENQENAPERMKDVHHTIDEMEKEEVRRMITEDKVRPDGRKPDEIRPLESEAGLLPRAHGSALFTRGQTQTLSALTLAPLKEYQVIDGLDDLDYKRFLHHYNFPQYSVGETGRPRSPGRREIGHGALGENALLPVIPSEEEFPYTIRLVSEVLESNGSSSQASITSSSLALMDAGVPIKAPVGGIAMGLIMGEDGNYTILTDIQGLEDHLGDMDFKVAGTKEGITALQMDIKIHGINKEILTEALAQAKKARIEIIENIESVLEEPRSTLSPYAPKIETLTIPQDKIKVVIGKGGETINEIIDETGVKIDIEEDGQVNIYGEGQEMLDAAREIIESLTEEVEVGKIYEGTVTRVEKYGAFVEILKGQSGLCHVSELSDKFIDSAFDVVEVGDTMTVKVTDIDNRNRINLSRKEALKKNEEENKE